MSDKANKATVAIRLDFKIPTIIGMVFNFTLSYLISLMSKGIVIAKTKRKREIMCKYVLVFRGMLFSEISKIIVLIVQVKAMINILQNGIFLRPRGYKMDMIPEIKMRI
jgi:hypothetical protein